MEHLLKHIGGGFSMGSSYFYLEVLLIWLSLLKSSGFKNPAIFALEYSLVPDESYPVQLHQTLAGYSYACSSISETSKICVAGDSAGATLVLSFLLHLGRTSRASGANGSTANIHDNVRPGMAVLISPWVTLLSSKDRDTARDYLNMTTLQIYAHQYSNNKSSLHDPRISPGHCKDPYWWQRASPSKGFYVTYGSEEVFAPEIRDLLSFWKDSDVAVEFWEERAGIHAWPVAEVFLSRMYKPFLEDVGQDLIEKC
jgi:acetyl esterase/lipase